VKTQRNRKGRKTLRGSPEKKKEGGWGAKGNSAKKLEWGCEEKLQRDHVENHKIGEKKKNETGVRAKKEEGIKLRNAKKKKRKKRRKEEG